MTLWTQTRIIRQTNRSYRKCPQRAGPALYIHQEWSKSLERRETDPEGAITTARTLLETTRKHLLDELGIPYEEKADLPKLYRLTSEALTLAPNQQSESVIRQVCGGCTAVVEGLGALRNREGDAHGRGKYKTRPAGRHAGFAVNLAGALAVFLVSSWQERSKVRPNPALQATKKKAAPERPSP